MKIDLKWQLHKWRAITFIVLGRKSWATETFEDMLIDYPNDAYAFTRSEFITMRNNGKEGEIFDTIISKYKGLEEKNDFMLVEGSDFSGEGMAIELDANILIAKNLLV